MNGVMDNGILQGKIQDGRRGRWWDGNEKRRIIIWFEKRVVYKM